MPSISSFPAVAFGGGGGLRRPRPHFPFYVSEDGRWRCPERCEGVGGERGLTVTILSTYSLNASDSVLLLVTLICFTFKIILKCHSNWGHIVNLTNVNP